MEIANKVLPLKKHSKRFYQFLISYVLIIVLLLAFVSSIVYSTFVATLTREVENSNLVKLRQIRDNIDTMVREMERLAVLISGNPVLLPFIATEEGYDSFKAVGELKKYTSTNNFIYDIMVYYIDRDKNHAYAASGIYDIDTFFKRQYQYDGWGSKDFISLIDNMQAPVIKPSEPVKMNGLYYEEMAAYIYSLPNNSSVRPYEAITFYIKVNEIKKMLNNALQDHNGYGFILNEKNECFAFVQAGDNNTGDADEIIKMLKTDTLNSPVSSAMIGENKFSIVKVLSEYNGWSYYLAMPAYQFMKKVDESRNVFNLVLVLVFIFGLTAAFIFTKGNYGPLEKLVEALKRQRQIDTAHGKTDEINFISQIISDVTKENKGLISQLKSQNSIIKEQFLLKLLKGKLENTNGQSCVEDISGIKFDGKYYAVMLFLIDDYNRFQDVNNKNMQDMLKYSITNIIEELSLEMGHGYAIDLANDDGIVLILNISIDIDIERRITELAYKAKNFFRENFDFSLSVGISDLYQNISMTRDYFLQASDSAYYRFVKGKNQVTFFKDIIAIKKDNYWYPVDEEIQLVMSIKQGRSCEIEKTILNITGNIVKQGLSLEMVRGICIGITNTVQKALVEIDIVADISFGTEIEDLLSLRFETIEAYKNYLVGFCEKLCRYMEKQKESKNFKLRDKIIDYVRDNYKDSSISVEGIADRFNLSPSYITRFYRDHTGYSLKQHIDNLRIDKAKELLRTTGLTLKDIISDVGYLDDTNFIRKFKKETGMTPIQYRNISKATRDTVNFL